MKSLLVAGLALTSVFALTSSSHAALINDTGISGGNINYNATQGSSDYLAKGDFFTLYDAGETAANLTGDLANSSLFTISYNLTDPPPPGLVGIPDDPTITNLRFTYIGTSNLTDTNLGTFTLADPSGEYHLVYEDGRYHGIAGPDSQVTEEIAPTLAATPEPSSLMLLGTGALGAVGAIRRRITR